MSQISLKSPIRFIFVAVVLVFVSPAGTAACDCPWPASPSVEMQNSKVVFMGRLLDEQVKAEPFTYKDRQGKTYQSMTDVYHFQFSVEKAWKGSPGEKVVLSSTLSDCMKWFKKSKLYVVYAYKGKFDLETSSCSRTREAHDIDIELQFLDAAVKGMSEQKIYSEIIQMAQTHHLSNKRLQALDFLDKSLYDTLPPDWIQSILKVFQDKSQRVRARVALMDKYKRIGKPPELIQALVGLLDDEWYTVRIAASDMLQSMIFQYEKNIAAALMEALRKEKIKMQKVTRLREPNRRVIRSLSKSIAKIGSKEDKELVFPYLLEDLSSSDVKIRHGAVVYMSSFGKLAEEAVPLLIEIYKNESRLKKKITGVILRNIGTPEARQALAN